MDSNSHKIRADSFEQAALPLIKWLCKNANPHNTVIVTCSTAELLSGEIGVTNTDYVPD